jgi:hypothetical protein
MNSHLLLAVCVVVLLGSPVQAGSRFLTTPVTALQSESGTGPTKSLKDALKQDQTRTGTIVLLWRSDCAPCLVELSRIAAFKEAAGSTRIATLALEPEAQARISAQRFSIPVENGFVTTRSMRQVLTSIRAGLLFMPTSVMISANGRICDSHIGILGTDKIAEWISRC